MNALVTELLLLQVALPLGLVILHAVVRPASAAGFVLRTVGIAGVILYTALAGVWLFPPYWMPWAIGALHALATLSAYRLYRRRRRSPGAWHRRRSYGAWRRYGEAGVAALVTAVAAWALVPALAGRVAPENAVAIAAPLEPGRYLVVNGGTRAALNNHLATLEGERFAPWRGQSHAVDLVAIDGFGLRADGVSPVDARRYFVHGRRVLAPCNGTVSASVDGLPDMPVPEMDREHLLGNHVLLDCHGYSIALSHLAPGSVRVAVGEDVLVGDELGQAGNSGNSADPHLHVHVQRELPPAEPISGEPLWLTIDGRFPVRNDVLEFH